MDRLEVDDEGTARLRVADTPTEAYLRDLLDAARDAGASRVIIETSHEAGEAWIRAGFSETARVLEASIDILSRHSADAAAAPSFGSVHVQTDDISAVQRAVEAMVRRLPGSSQGSIILPPANGWVSVFDELCDREPEMLRRLSTELADRMGTVVLLIGVEEGRVVRFVLFERGRIMDEYLSVPEYHGPLPPGEVIAMGANPRVVNRLTGANAARIREVARTAERPEDLPAPEETLAHLAEAFGVSAATERFEAAMTRAGAIVLSHER